MKVKWFVYSFSAAMIVIIPLIISAILITIGLSSGSSSSSNKFTYDFCPKDGDANITNLLEPIRKNNKVPAICAAVVTSDGLKCVGAVGVRKIGTEVPVTINDKWHLGSDTKAMTATVIGKLVEDGKLKWRDTLGEIFAELESSMHEKMKNVTVLQILSHRAGLTANLDWPGISQNGTLQEQRYNAVKQAISQKPESMPGTKYVYSNLGYVISGAIIEKITNSTYEEQITKLLFEPLDMKSTGFGGTGTIGQIDQPWPHNDNGAPAGTNGLKMDNPLVMASAGCVHCSMADWGKFITDQLRGAMRKDALLQQNTYEAIQMRHFDDDYALGWGVVEREWGDGDVLAHCGCNTMNLANVWIAPKRDFAIVVCVNQGGDAGFKASDEAVGAIINYYFKKPASKETASK
ncbi:MAG: serine hydrolase domain-containing protein [Phycisphaerales bacterium]